MAIPSTERAAVNRLRRRNVTRYAQRAAHLRRLMKEIAELAETADASQIAALRLQLDCYRHLHDKVEADQKNIEHSGQIGSFDALALAVLNAGAESGTHPSREETVQ